ncbi:hypothetical protein V8F06_010358 [Rhypophila decipiens]
MPIIADDGSDDGGEDKKDKGDKNARKPIRQGNQIYQDCEGGKLPDVKDNSGPQQPVSRLNREKLRKAVSEYCKELVDKKWVIKEGGPTPKAPVLEGQAKNGKSMSLSALFYKGACAPGKNELSFGDLGLEKCVENFATTLSSFCGTDTSLEKYSRIWPPLIQDGGEPSTSPSPPPPAPPLHNYPDVQQDDDLGGLRDIQRSNRVFFKYWRKGDVDGYDRLGAAQRAEKRGKVEHPVERAAKPVLDKVTPHVIRKEWDDGTVDIKGPAWMVKAQGDLRLGGYFINKDPPTPAWERATNSVTEMARELWNLSVGTAGAGTSRLRFVKLLGAGGQGFVALFDARVENQAPAQWDVNFYVVKAIDARAWYRDKVRSLRKEKFAQLDMMSSQHAVQCFGANYERQLERARGNSATTAHARLVDQRDGLNDWQGRGQPAWNNWTMFRAAADVALRIARPLTAARKAALGGAQPPPARRVPGIQQPQVTWHPPLPPNLPNPGAAYNQNVTVQHGYDQTYSNPDYLFLEYVPRGDLYKFIEKQNSEGRTGGNERPPNRVLWLIWQCFLKMVVALDQPVADQRKRDLPPKDHRGPHGSEAYVNIPAGQPGYTPKRNYVHFYIDPQNILVGPTNSTGIKKNHIPLRNLNLPSQNLPLPLPHGQREDGHGNAPLFKLSDFGLAKSQNPAYNRNLRRRGRRHGLYAETEVHGVRRCGKHPFLTPEQFTEEWETVNLWPFERPNPNAPANAPNANPAPPNPPTNPRKRKRGDHYVPPKKKPTRKPPNQTTRQLPQTPVVVAGLYGWKTNLYQLALTMRCVITGHYPPDVPVAQRIIKTTIIPDPNGGDPQTTDEPIYTYGGYLLDDRHNLQCDRELRETLALCMAERPGDRPDHELLTQQVKRKLAYYAAVNDSSVAGQPPFPDNDWAPNHPPNNAPPSEKAWPSMDSIMVWSDRAFGDPPPTRLRDSTEYNQWVAAIVRNNQGDYEYRYATDLRDLREI